MILLKRHEYKSYSVKLREIRHSDALEGYTWASSWKDSQKVPIWEWRDMYSNYHFHAGVKRFDTALLMNNRLCALCYGVPTRRELVLKIHAISRNPNNNPLEGKILTIMLFAASAYARVLGAEELWLCKPMNEKLVKIYETAGYIAHRNNFGSTTHLSLRLR